MHIGMGRIPRLFGLHCPYIVCLMALTMAGCKHGAQTSSPAASVADVRANTHTHWRGASTEPPGKRFGRGLPPRDVIDINSNWEFNYFPSSELDRSLAATHFNSSSWSLVSVPHTWSTYETTGELHPFIAAPRSVTTPIGGMGGVFIEK